MTKLLAKVILVITICLGVIFWQSPTKVATVATPNREMVDETFNEVKLLRYDADGNLNQSITVEKWLHYTGDEKIYLINPSLNSKREDGNWHIKSTSGIGYPKDNSKGVDKIELTENVNIIMHNANNQDNWQLNSEHMTIFPEEQIATTDQEVAINHNNINMHSKGMRADLATQTIELNDKVRGDFTNAK